MSVYVDRCKHPFERKGSQLLMCHMVADSLDELHIMAEVIGMQRRWFQDKPRHPHYDLTEERRALAITQGAIEVQSKEIVRVLRRLQNRG